MAKKVTRKKSKTSLQRELSNLKKEKIKTLKLRKQLAARKKEIEEIAKLRREVASLKGVGTKRRLAGQVTKRLGKDVGRVGWKGLKFLGKSAKSIIDAENRRQAADAARDRKRKRK